MNFNFNKAKIIGFTETMIEKDGNKIHLNLVETIAYIARVSSPENQATLDTSEKLIKYLLKNKHWSPFEMVNIVIEIECPRDISRQLIRHKSLSFQEFSQRYSNIDKIGMIDSRQCRLQDYKNRQNSIHTDDAEKIDTFQRIQRDLINTQLKYYHELIDAGIAKECARVLLSEGLTISRLYCNGSLRSWIHYLSVRCDKSTQLEHRDLAFKILSAIEQIFPLIKTIVDDIHI